MTPFDARRNLGAIVLATGAGSRFGGGKLLARLDDRPILQHLLDALAEADLAATIVVLGEDAPAIEAAVAWRAETRVRNPEPGRGLSSSVKLGIAAARAVEPPLDGVFVALGDQPRTRPDVLRELAAAAASTTARAIIVPRYADDSNPNPALLLRAAWALVDGLTGDRGLGPLLAANPELVTVVPVAGSNPDIDTRADLESA